MQTTFWVRGSLALALFPQTLPAFAGLNSHFFGLPHVPAGQGEQEETPGLAQLRSWPLSCILVHGPQTAAPQETPMAPCLVLIAT